MERLDGGPGDDVLYGDWGLNEKGEQEGSVTYGGPGRDHHIGSDSHDLMVADIDADILEGGDGRDTYYIMEAAAGSRIQDYSPRNELVLEGLGYNQKNMELSVNDDLDRFSISFSGKLAVEIVTNPLELNQGADGGLDMDFLQQFDRRKILSLDFD